MVGNARAPPWSRFAVLAVGATFLLIGVAGALVYGYFLSDLHGADGTVFILLLVQSLVVAALGAALMATAKTYGGAGVPRLKPIVILFSLAILATAAVDFYINSQGARGSVLTEGIMLLLVGLGGLAAGVLSFTPSPNQRNGLIVGAAGAFLLFITFMIRDNAVSGFSGFAFSRTSAVDLVPGLVSHGPEAVFKLLAILVAAIVAATWAKMQHPSGRALVVLGLGAAVVMLGIGLLIGAMNGFGDKPLDNMSAEPGMVATAQVVFFVSLLTGLAAAILVAGAALAPSLAALNHFSSPQQAGAPGQPSPAILGFSSRSEPGGAAGPEVQPYRTQAGPGGQGNFMADKARVGAALAGGAVLLVLIAMFMPIKSMNAFIVTVNAGVWSVDGQAMGQGHSMSYMQGCGSERDCDSAGMTMAAIGGPLLALGGVLALAACLLLLKRRTRLAAPLSFIGMASIVTGLLLLSVGIDQALKGAGMQISGGFYVTMLAAALLAAAGVMARQAMRNPQGMMPTAYAESSPPGQSFGNPAPWNQPPPQTMPAYAAPSYAAPAQPAPPAPVLEYARAPPPVARPAPVASRPVAAQPAGRLMQCPKCSTQVAVLEGAKPVCTNCGFGA